MEKKINSIFVLYIIFTLNNIFFLLTNSKGSIKTLTSCGNYKIKGLKKITINSIRTSLKFVTSTFSKKYSYPKIYIKLKGLNKFKKIVLKQIKQSSWNILYLCDDNLTLHGGCKCKKKRKL